MAVKNKSIKPRDNRPGRPERGYTPVGLNLKIPATKRERLRSIAGVVDMKETELVMMLIARMHTSVLKKNEEYERGQNENKKHLEFIKQFEDENQALVNADPEAARSAALKAYYDQSGFDFGADEESFILPKPTE